MNVLGDALDLVLSSIDPTLLRSMYTKIQEDDHSPAGSRNKILLHRPWTDILMENREKWQKKHDAGMCLLIYLFEFSTSDIQYDLLDLL